jgi:hypothetical protein
MGLVDEFHRPPKTALGDGSGIGVVQGDDPRVAPSGTPPPMRVRVWATTFSSAPMVRSMDLTRFDGQRVCVDHAA